MRWPKLEDFAYFGDAFFLGLGNALLLLGTAITVTAVLGALALAFLHEWCFDTSCLEFDGQQEATSEEPQDSPAAG